MSSRPSASSAAAPPTALDLGTSDRRSPGRTGLETATAVSALSALAQASRLAVFRLLVEYGPDGLPAGEIANRLGIPNTTLSFHLKELTHAGLVSATQRGRFVIYAPDVARMNALIAFLTDNCCGGSHDCGLDGPGSAVTDRRPGGRIAGRAR